jgi:hypothetical protein
MGAEVMPDDRKRVGHRLEHDKFRRAGLRTSASEGVTPVCVAA